MSSRIDNLILDDLRELFTREQGYKVFQVIDLIHPKMDLSSVIELYLRDNLSVWSLLQYLMAVSEISYGTHNLYVALSGDKETINIGKFQGTSFDSNYPVYINKLYGARYIELDFRVLADSAFLRWSSESSNNNPIFSSKDDQFLDSGLEYIPFEDRCLGDGFLSRGINSAYPIRRKNFEGYHYNTSHDLLHGRLFLEVSENLESIRFNLKNASLTYFKLWDTLPENCRPNLIYYKPLLK